MALDESPSWCFSEGDQVRFVGVPTLTTHMWVKCGRMARGRTNLERSRHRHLFSGNSRQRFVIESKLFLGYQSFQVNQENVGFSGM